MSKTYPELNYHGQDWARLKHWVASLLQNDLNRISGDCDVPHTERLRGRIALAKQILSWEEMFTKDVTSTR